MNCKPGDLAIIIRSLAGNEGKIVRCISFLGMSLWSDRDGRIFLEATWEIDQMLPGCDGIALNQISDSQLRPIPGDLLTARDYSEALGLYDAPKVREGGVR